jgi:vacuolar iron transporter family protein
MALRHTEVHRIQRSGWLRAAVLGANDGIVSTASLIVGVAAADGGGGGGVILAGIAGLVAGALSMAAGEFVSVSSQADSEAADLERERRELATDDVHEHSELAGIYVARGLDPELAREVARQLMAHDALGAHARDELGISDSNRANPVQAALSSALSFAAGAALPLLAAAFAPAPARVLAVSVSSIFFLAILGAVAARTGGSALLPSVLRVSIWGAVAMGVTALVGGLVGARL